MTNEGHGNKGRFSCPLLVSNRLQKHPCKAGWPAPQGCLIDDWSEYRTRPPKKGVQKTSKISNILELSSDKSRGFSQDTEPSPVFLHLSVFVLPFDFSLLRMATESP